MFVSQEEEEEERKVLIASPVLSVSLCKVSKDNSVSSLIVLYLFSVIISANHSSIESGGGEGRGEEGRIIE